MADEPETTSPAPAESLAADATAADGAPVPATPAPPAAATDPAILVWRHLADYLRHMTPGPSPAMAARDRLLAIVDSMPDR